MTIETSPQFLACLPFILKEEGGYSNDPHDPGGMTMYGIVQKEYDAYRKGKGLALQWVRKISKDEVHDIYYNSYWMPHCPMLPTGVDLSFFDMCVNAGPMRAIAILQQSYGILGDGLWGDQTTTAVMAKPIDIPTVIKIYAASRIRYYKSLRTFTYFGKGWTNRVNDIETAALAMAEKGTGEV
jgi:lysozyme family protein